MWRKPQILLFLSWNEWLVFFFPSFVRQKPSERKKNTGGPVHQRQL